MRTCWLKNNKQEIYNLTPASLYSEEYGCLFSKMKGTGYETKLVVNSIGYDFSITEKNPTQVPISGFLYFRDPRQMKEFEDFKQDEVVRLYYDSTGRIDPRDQISKGYYKEVYVSKLDNGEEDNCGWFVCAVTMTPLSAVWRRDTVIASTVSGIIGDPHIIPFYYPYFYQSQQKLYLDLFNDGDRVGCKVIIKNNRLTSIDRLSWTVESGKRKQYAEWLGGGSILASGRTLIIDSRPQTQEAIIIYENEESDVSLLRSPSTQFINFVDIFNGKNLFMFDVGGVDDVEIIVEYSEQTRVV